MSSGTLQVGQSYGVAPLRFGDVVVGELKHLSELAVGDGRRLDFVDLLRRVIGFDEGVRPRKGVVEVLDLAAEGGGDDGHASLGLQEGNEVVSDVDRVAPVEGGELGLKLGDLVLHQLRQGHHPR